MKQILIQLIIWQGNSIRCMKSARTPRCTLCMRERKEILQRFQKEPTKIISNNFNIFAFCTCKGSFHRLSRKITTCTTLMTQSTQKKSSPQIENQSEPYVKGNPWPDHRQHLLPQSVNPAPQGGRGHHPWIKRRHLPR